MAVDLADIKDRLNITTSNHDFELLELLAAAEAEYRSLIGPLDVETFTEVHRGPTAVPWRRPVVSITSVTDPEGFAVDYTFGPNYGAVSTSSRHNLTITYTAGYTTLPDNIRELILADVAGLYAATQRGGGQGRPTFPGDSLAPEEPGSPLVMWPRIREAARRSAPAIA